MDKNIPHELLEEFFVDAFNYLDMQDILIEKYGSYIGKDSLGNGYLHKEEFGDLIIRIEDSGSPVKPPLARSYNIVFESEKVGKNVNAFITIACDLSYCLHVDSLDDVYTSWVEQLHDEIKETLCNYLGFAVFKLEDS